MKNTHRLLALLLTVVMILGSLPLSVFATTDSNGSEPNYDTAISTSLSSYLLDTTAYVDDTYVGATAQVTVYADTAPTVPTDKRDVIVYVKNWNGTRFEGTEDDVTIVESYITAKASVETGNKAVVVVLDYGYSGGDYANNSVVGVIEKSLSAYRETCLKGKLKLSDGNTVTVNAGVVHFLPEGYRVERDILFWESDYHSSYGTMNSVLNAWNKELAKSSETYHDNVYYDYYTSDDIVTAEDENGNITYTTDNRSEYDKKAGAVVGSPKHDENGNIVPYPDGHIAPTVSRVEDCLKPDGSSMDYGVRLDIIHPAFKDGATKIKTPVMMVGATQSPRTTYMMSDPSHSFLGSYSFGGFTAVVYDFSYIPMARSDHYGYMNRYGTAEYNAAKWGRAAVRCVRYYAETYGYSDEFIGVAAISKATPAASVLSVKNNAGVPEKQNYTTDPNGTLFEGRTTGGTAHVVQPFLTYEGGYGTATEKSATNPTATNSQTGTISSEVTVAYLAAGVGIDWQYQDTPLRTYLEANGGTVPLALSCGQSDPYGCWERYAPMIEYKSSTSEAVFFSMPMEDLGHQYPYEIDPIRNYDRHAALNTFLKGYLLEDSYAPSVAYITPKQGTTDVAFNSAIQVQFIANTQIDIEQVKNNVTVKSVDGTTTVDGTWSTDDAKMSNLFTFTPDRLEIGTEYIVTVPGTITDGNSKKLSAGMTVTFTTEGFSSSDAVSDTYVSEAEPDRSFIDEAELVVDPSTTSEKIALLTFDKDIVTNSRGLTLVLPNITGNAANVEVSVIDGYAVSADTTYNSVKDDLDKAVKVTETALTSGTVRIDVTKLMEYVTSSRFTIVIRGAEKHHYFIEDFSEALVGFNSSDTGTTDEAVKTNEGISKDTFKYRIFSKYYDYKVGYNANVNDFAIVKDTTDSTHSTYGTTGHGTNGSNNRRYKFYNSVSNDPLTEADIGKTLKVSFWAKAVPKTAGSTATTFLYYGLMAPDDSTTLTNKFNLSTEWQQMTDYTITITKEMVTSDNPKAMFSLVTPSTSGFTYYYDDIIIEEVVEADSVSQDSSESDAVPPFIIARAEYDSTLPYADAYVSSVYPDKNFGDISVLRVNGGETENIALVSFKNDLISSFDYLEVQLPLLNDTCANVEVSVIPKLLIEGGSVTYNKIKDTLETAISIGTYPLSKGVVKLDLSSCMDKLKDGMFFTLVVKSADTVGHVLNIDFEEYDAGSTFSLTDSGTVATTYYTGNDGYLGLAGYNGFPSNNFIPVKEENGNKYAAFMSKTNTAGAGLSRWGVFNGLAYRALTDDDVGKQLQFIAKVRLADGYTSGTVSFGVRDWSGSNKWEKKTSKTLSDNEWTLLTFTHTLTQDDVNGTYVSNGNTLTYKYMLTFEFGTSEGAGIGFDVDDVAVVDSNSKLYAATVASSEYESATALKLFAANIDEVMADTYVSMLNPKKAYGNEKTLSLGDENGDKKIMALSFMDDIFDRSSDSILLELPNSGNDLGKVSVFYVDDYLINESELTYNTMPEYESNLLGTYNIVSGSNKIDISSLRDKINGDYFTLVFRTDAHSYANNFEGYNRDLYFSTADNNVVDETNTAMTHYHGFTTSTMAVENSLARTGGSMGNRKIVAETDGNKALEVTVGKNSTSDGRLKFYNSIADSLEGYENAIGKTYRFTAYVKATVDTATSTSTNPKTLGTKAFVNAMSSRGTKDYYATKNWKTVNSGSYTEFTVVYTVSAAHVGTSPSDYPNDTYSYPMFSIEFEDPDTSSSTTNYSYMYLVDNLSVVELVNGNPVADVVFASCQDTEAEEKIRLLTFSSTEVTLDENITVLETSAALTIADEGVSDLFFVVGDSAYSLLSVDDATGNLFFTMNGERYELCDSYGNEYLLGDEAMPVAAIYDSANGTVRFAVNGYLAYYKNGGAITDTYGTKLVDGGDSGDVKIGVMSTAGSVSASAVKATTVKSETPEIIGTQTKYTQLSIRVVSGIDMLYYSKIGFDVTCGDKTTYDEGNLVYSSIEADDKPITAESLEVGYLATIVIEELDKDTEINGKTFTVTPYVYINDNKKSGETVEYKITKVDSVFTVSEVTSNIEATE